MSNQKKPKKKGYKAGIIAFGIVFALLSWMFKFHSIPAFAFAFVLSGMVGAVVKTMASGIDLSTKQKTPESLKKVEGSTGNPDIDGLLERGRAMIIQIREENALIPDTGLTEKLDKLENQCAEVFRAVYDKPEKASQIRKFMEYYLPTTLKMVKGYRVLGERNLEGQDVKAARKRIDDALGVVLEGCQKMLDKLYHDDVLDITTDIDVLEQMLKRDGLTESELERAAEQARKAAQIDAHAAQLAQARAAEKQRLAQEAEQRARMQAQQEAEERAARLAAQKAAEEARAAELRQAAPAPYRQADSGVRNAVEDAVNKAQNHIPQAPTISGGMYPTYGGEAAAVAPKEEE